MKRHNQTFLSNSMIPIAEAPPIFKKPLTNFEKEFETTPLLTCF